MPTIAFLGPEGTFAHQALRALPSSAGATLLPLANVTLAIDAVRDGRADSALVPLENSVEGAVAATVDELANGPALVIAEETYLSVSFELLARPGTALAGVTSVATHPHAEAQVRRWLIDNLPRADVSLVGSTAGAAASVAAGEFDAAVAAAVAGELNGLDVLAHDIADNDGAVTRFVRLTRPGPPPPRTGNDRTTFVAYLRENHAGALLELLSELANRGINMTRIESRPDRSPNGRAGMYCFSVDCEGHVADERVGDALAALHRVCADVRYLGSYPRRDGAQGAVPVGRTDPEFADARTWLARVRESGTDQDGRLR